MAVHDKQTTISTFGTMIDVTFSWLTEEGLIEGQTVRNIDLSDYEAVRKVVVDMMLGVGHKPYVPRSSATRNNQDKQYIWLNADGTATLKCKDVECDGTCFYVEGEQKDKKPYQSIRCDKLTDFSEENKRKHTNWYNNGEHKMSVEIATGNKIKTRRGVEDEYIKVELPDRGGNQHDTAKLVYGDNTVEEEEEEEIEEAPAPKKKVTTGRGNIPF